MAEKKKVYGRYDKRPRFRKQFHEKTKTKQEFRQDCDLSNILSKYTRQDVLDHMVKHQGTFRTVSDMDFHQAMNTVKKAESMFAGIPAQIRAQFDNDPGKFLNFVSDSRNTEKLVEMGLVDPDMVAQEAPGDPSKPSRGVTPQEEEKPLKGSPDGSESKEK